VGMANIQGLQFETVNYLKIKNAHKVRKKIFVFYYVLPIND